ncbi:MAG: hypothetical protein HOI40_01920 [Candidatus Marinimicrobia bacterium]|nr:hypothetical protein [Candidatus Neomarinimicrobiota bacterium]
MVHKKSAVFDEKKLNWISGQHLSQQSNHTIFSNIKVINANWGKSESQDFCLGVIELMKSRSKSLIELMEQSDYYFNDPIDFDEKSVRKTWKNETGIIVETVQSILEKHENWTTESLEETLKTFMAENDLGFGKVMNPIRLALCGTVNGPSLFAIMSLIGQDTCLRRISHALDTL